MSPSPAYDILVAPAGVRAQDRYPSRPIELVVPYAPGGGTDIMFRHLVKVIETHKLLPLTIVNKTGGSGAVGKGYMIRSKPDGYVLGAVDPSNVTQQPLGEVTWDYRRDFTYIAKLVDDVNLVIVRKESPAQVAPRSGGGGQAPGKEVRATRSRRSSSWSSRRPTPSKRSGCLP